MSIQPATCILDAPSVARVVRRLAHEILERHTGMQGVVLVGIREGGLPLAEMLGKTLGILTGEPVSMVALDINGFRDDRPRANHNSDPIVTTLQGGLVSAITMSGKSVVIVDDVIQTGRSLRAALDALTSLARPASVESAVLVDRGHRELPLRPTYVGKNIPAALDDWVEVRLGSENPGAFLVKR